MNVRVEKTPVDSFVDLLNLDAEKLLRQSIEHETSPMGSLVQPGKQPPDWLHQSATVSIGWPGHPNVFAKRLVWAPFGLPACRLISLLSSRLGQRLDDFPRLFDAIRTRAAHANPAQAFVTAKGMTTDRFVRRAAEWFGVNLVEIQEMPDAIDEQWLNDSAIRNNQLRWSVFISKPVNESASMSETSIPETFCFDTELSQLADEVDILHVKKKGNVSAAIEKRLQSRLGITSILDTCHESLVNSYCEKGAALWHLLESNQDIRDQKRSGMIVDQGDKSKSRLALCRPVNPEQIDFSQFLTHCTRAQKLNWIDESETQAIDRMLLQPRSRLNSRLNSEIDIPESHTALGTLLKIVAQRRIIAGNSAIRDKHSCVSFSGQPLPELVTQRKFRHHRSRWDFEPYGLAIRKTVLQSLGAGSVIYGDEDLWRRLDEKQKPFFQKQFTQNLKIDWSLEKEWRLNRDLDMKLLGGDDAFVFVKEESEVAMISQFSLWPVFSMEKLSRLLVAQNR